MTTCSRTGSYTRRCTCPACVTRRAAQKRDNQRPAKRAHWTALHKRIRAAAFTRDRHRCTHCGSSDRLSLDYIVPLSRGGQQTLANAQTLCVSCNSSKGDRFAGAPRKKTPPAVPYHQRQSRKW